jgi:hypothetical protein
MGRQDWWEGGIGVLPLDVEVRVTFEGKLALTGFSANGGE